MGVTRRWILEMLADGRRHAGAALARELGVTRAALGQHIERLRDDGWVIEGRAGGGYCLCGPGTPLRRRLIEQELTPLGERLASLEILDTVASTSDHLRGQTPPAPGCVHVCVAELQTAGRGRRGRGWRAHPGQSITQSLDQVLGVAPAALTSLGLVVALATAETLERAGITGIQLKWPNDLECNGAKLGGILLDVTGEAVGSARVVTGIGINHDLPHRIRDIGGRAVTAIREHWPHAPARDIIAGRVACAVAAACEGFAADGAVDLKARWAQRDSLAGRPVTLDFGNGHTEVGRAVGIDDDGALLLETKAKLQRCLAGEVSVRAV